MGLPRGSVRAVIALLLIMLVFIAAIFLFDSTRAESGQREFVGISAQQLARSRRTTSTASSRVRTARST